MLDKLKLPINEQCLVAKRLVAMHACMWLNCKLISLLISVFLNSMIKWESVFKQAYVPGVHFQTRG